MFLSIGIAFGVSLIVAAIFSYAFTRLIRSRLYSLEVDVADLQDRYLRSIRKAAANKRWDGEEELDSKIAEAVLTPVAPAKKGWRKWGSRSESSSEGSQAAQ